MQVLSWLEFVVLTDLSKLELCRFFAEYFFDYGFLSFCVLIAVYAGLCLA